MKFTLRKLFIITGIVLGLGIILMAGVMFFLTPYQVFGNSMSPKIKDGELVFANKIRYLITAPKRQDVVGYYPPEKDYVYVGRIIGLPGDIISIKNGEVYLNNTKLENTLVEKIKPRALKNEQDYTVAEDEYFILGDDRHRSADSRTFGFIKRDRIFKLLNKN